MFFDVWFMQSRAFSLAQMRYSPSARDRYTFSTEDRRMAKAPAKKKTAAGKKAAKGKSAAKKTTKSASKSKAKK